jgi:hypothetical protein
MRSPVILKALQTGGPNVSTVGLGCWARATSPKRCVLLLRALHRITLGRDGDRAVRVAPQTPEATRIGNTHMAVLRDAHLRTSPQQVARRSGPNHTATGARGADATNDMSVDLLTCRIDYVARIEYGAAAAGYVCLKRAASVQSREGSAGADGRSRRANPALAGGGVESLPCRTEVGHARATAERTADRAAATCLAHPAFAVAATALRVPLAVLAVGLTARRVPSSLTDA